MEEKNADELFTIYMENFETLDNSEFKTYMAKIYNFLIQLDIYVPFCRSEQDLSINDIIYNVTRLRKETDNKFMFDTYYGHAMCYRIFGVTLFKLMNELINGKLIIPRIYPNISDDMYETHTFVIIYNIIKCLCLEFKHCMLLQNYFMTLNLFIQEPFSNLLKDFDELNDHLIQRIDTESTFFSTFYSIRNGPSSILRPVIVPAAEPVIVPAEEPVIVPAEEPVIVPAAEPVIVPAVEPVEGLVEADSNASENSGESNQLPSAAAAGGSKFRRNSSIKRFTGINKRRKSIKRKIIIEVE
jgi:hypothetical protein